MFRKFAAVALAATMVVSMTACGSSEKEDTVTVNVFAAASLSNVMSDLEASYEESNPGVDIVINADSSGTLMTQIEEGAPCDVFFSAAQKQMDQLDEEGLVNADSRVNVVNNQLVVITQAESETSVTGLADINKASSIALADGSVPVGKYTRQAMVALGLLEEAEDSAAITTSDVISQLGVSEISEQSNVSKVLEAVEEGSSEVGTTYLSDTIGHEDSIRIIEVVPYDVTGNIIYPVAQINNEEATDEEKEAALDFIKFITNDDAEKLYEQYGFDTNVK